MARTKRGVTSRAKHNKVLKRVKGNSANYIFNKNDLFVRAKISSDQIKTNPYVIGETTQAWTQPVIVN